jgi:hypothetical protein
LITGGPLKDLDIIKVYLTVWGEKKDDKFSQFIVFDI